MNNSLDILKSELNAQKTAILSKGGVVNVAGVNPTPAEITTGIESISTPDYSSATAQESDVVAGKTFIAGNSQIKTGTLSYSPDMLSIVTLYTNTASTQTEFSLTFPEGLTYLRQYAFYSNPNPVAVYFDSAITKIEQYAFYNARNFRFMNFNTLQSLSTIQSYAFTQTYDSNIAMDALPSSIRIIQSYAFQDAYSAGQAIVVPPLTSLGDFAFGSNQGKKQITSLSWSNGFAVQTLPGYLVYNLQVSSQLTIPASVKTLASYSFYGSKFASYVIPSTVTKLGDKTFHGSTVEALSYYADSYIKFERETPPTFGTNLIATQMLSNNIKIYVPDNSVDAYKTANNFSQYASYVYPVSQMP